MSGGGQAAFTPKPCEYVKIFLSTISQTCHVWHSYMIVALSRWLFSYDFQHEFKQCFSLHSSNAIQTYIQCMRK